ncbi:MAG TPA: amidohydrolase family protein [Clostridia bacterium]|nr:amidohydrolase family protein [Clostridia bacterium]
MKRFFIKNASLLLPCGLQTGSIEFDSTITALRRSNDSCAPDCECETLDAHGGFVVPGLFDIHTHGACGADFSDADFSDRNVLNDIHECNVHECSNYKCNEFDADSFPLDSPLFRLSRYYLSQGVTSFLATTMTEFIKRTPKRLHHLAGAKCIGINLEGPFLSSSKRGSQAECNLLAPDAALFHQLNAASGGRIKLVTVAPELPGAFEFIRSVSGCCTVSEGHSAADYNTAIAAFRAGASHVTHIFNGMNDCLHRSPGIAGAAADLGIPVELICDGLHVHPAVVRGVFRVFGKKTCLISDSLRCAGMPDGRYSLGGQEFVLSDGCAALADGTLAGSAISLADAVRNAVSFGISPSDAFFAASYAPFASVFGDSAPFGLECGRAADLAVFDANLNLKAVFMDGERML